MPVTLSWEQIALRLLLALVASFLIGYDRDEHGKTSGVRTIMLVCLAATLAMLQANLLMNSTGKASDSFVVLDLMRLPLGILSGIGFIGAGAILRRDGMVHGLTTAATLWFVTVLGLLFGGGQLVLGSIGTAIALFILWVLKQAEKFLPTRRSATLTLVLNDPAQSIESDLRTTLQQAGFSISTWTTSYIDGANHAISCDLTWPCSGAVQPSTPPVVHKLLASAKISKLTWKS